MTDRYGRKIEYLRLSVTDLCNYRCIYCMGKDGVCKKSHSDILSIEELTEIARAAYALGIRKIRLTGGEPLVRKGILTLCENIRALGGDIDLSLTTNGSLLRNMTSDLKASGVDRLNISLDTLNEETFNRITRGGKLSDVLDGLKAAEEAGFTHTKINTVLMGGVNDNEIIDLINLARDNPVSVRFIELMPMDVVSGWDNSRFISTDIVENLLRKPDLVSFDGVARVYRPGGFIGTVGVISPLSHSFCNRCNRIRVTADGKLKPCLHSKDEIDLRGLSGDELLTAIREGVLNKPECHHLGEHHTDTPRSMNEIGG
ncbi:MAG: GTP 3',8-cyclase MoaA [Ruminococcus sp.]|nr:GTP 3',8-cyclase MoaA [Ruminococcus sp.]